MEEPSSSLLQLILGGEEIEENAAAEMMDYINELAKNGLDQLLSEQTRQKAEAVAIGQRLERLASENRHIFVEGQESLTDVVQKVDKIEEYATQVSTKLPEVSHSCKDFVKKAEGIAQARSQARAMLGYHNQLLELMEIPQLADTCVQGELYDEVLELRRAAHVLSRRYRHIHVVQDIKRDVEQSTQQLLLQLQQQLCDKLSLPMCMRVVSYIQRLSVYTEEELRLLFLRARGVWIDSVLRGIPTEQGVYAFLKEWVNVVRLNLLDIITQYHAIFADEEGVMSMQRKSKKGAVPRDAFLNSWLLERVGAFLHTLEEGLPKVEETSQWTALLRQCQGFGQGMSRVGVDFRPLIPPVFERCVFDRFFEDLSTATQEFLEEIEQGTWEEDPSSVDEESARQHPLQPPMALLAQPPLARLWNAIAEAMNGLRLCAPLELQSSLARQLEDMLMTAALPLQELTLSNSIAVQEKAIRMRTAFVDQFAPFVQHCFVMIYGVEINMEEIVAVLQPKQ